MNKLIEKLDFTLNKVNAITPIVEMKQAYDNFNKDIEDDISRSSPFSRLNSLKKEK